MAADAYTSTTIPWPEPDGPWLATFHWVSEEGSARLVGLDLRGFGCAPTDLTRRNALSAEELTSSLLRSFPLGRLSNQAYENLVEYWKDDPLFALTPRPRERAPSEQSSQRGRGRPQAYDPAEVARVYRANRRRPTSAVAEHFGVSPAAAGKRVARARQLGLLEPTTKGRATPPSGDLLGTPEDERAARRARQSRRRRKGDVDAST